MEKKEILIKKNKEIKELEKLESDFNSKIRELNELLSNLEYQFDYKELDRMNRVNDELIEIREEFFKKGEKVSDEISDLERKRILTQEEIDDLYEKNPYSDEWDHSAVADLVGRWGFCKCILCFGTSSKGYEGSWSNFYRKQGEKLKDEYEKEEEAD
ncbi:MAG: hypothetical protein I3273_04155 [Candidatus Moeniiplasma glomeromycotorum]|nr:hypothetical protein [Candidatus Moeniiplasma glomeromycotorum]